MRVTLRFVVTISLTRHGWVRYCAVFGKRLLSLSIDFGEIDALEEPSRRSITGQP